MAKTADRPGRRKPSREQYPIILIVCEGVVTEKEYFKGLHRLWKVPIRLEIMAGGFPQTLVRKAVSAKKSKQYDDVWVVFDIDEHPGIDQARQQARDNGIKTAISNPCFELWPLLHFRDQTAYIERHLLRSLCRGHMPRYEKELPCEQLIDRTDEALRRAAELRATNRRNDMLGGNPSTDADYLVKRIQDARINSGPQYRRT